MTGRPALLVFILAGSLAAFGGIYAWAIPPIVVGALVLTAVTWRQPDDPSRDVRALDWSIGVLIAAIAVQIIPLPSTLRSLLSPHLSTVEHAVRPDAALGIRPSGPLSLDPAATWEALALVIAVALTYRAARRIFSRGGVRSVSHAVSVIGAIAAVEALVQRALTPTLIYGFWQPSDIGAMPFGPVVNRNHFASWLLMAIAMTTGYLIARVSRRTAARRSWRSFRRVVVGISQSSVSWTVSSVAVMTVTVLASQSRSALIGLAVAAATGLRSVGGTWRPVVAAGGGVLVVAALLLAAGESTATRVADRFAETLERREVSRVVIWRETLPMVTDFALTGVGAGAFGHAMLTYQQTRAFAPHLGMDRHFNHAHNHYLQVAAEGGVLVGLPLVVVLVLFFRVVRQRLQDDLTELRTVRLGAVAGLAGIATQSVWEVPLTMPAAALLCATLAALATYRRATRDYSVEGAG